MNEYDLVAGYDAYTDVGELGVAASSEGDIMQSPLTAITLFVTLSIDRSC